jgi:vacuolar-type H+-ATPase subunit D/Vma8
MDTLEQKKSLLLSKIATSKKEVLEAEEHLSSVLKDAQGGPRAQKTTVTEVVREAIAKLRNARTDLEDLDKLISGKE